MAYFGEWLAQRRADFGLTLRDLAEVADVAPAKISAWERGLEEPPFEFRDACWDALKRDGEEPPLDPSPVVRGVRAPDVVAGRRRARTGSSAPATWLEVAAERRGTTIEATLRAFGMSPSLKYHWRAGKSPSPATQWKLVQFLEIPEDEAREHGWDPRPADE